MSALSMFALAIVATPSLALAHPPVSVVMDARGNVFYSDLSRVWMIARSGERSIVVPNVHSHQLVLDASGNLYGEHLWYEGRQTKKWGHRVWKRSPNGTITDVIPASEGFLTGYGFVRDPSNTMYFASGSPAEIRKRKGDGPVTVHSRGPFRNLKWMVAGPDGTLFLVDSVDLKKILPDGRVTVLARNIASRSLTRPTVSRQHAVMGLWLDSAGFVYAANYGSGDVKRVSPKGEVSVVAHSRLPWSPTGGMIAPDGDMWILETSIVNEVRLKRIARNGSVRYY